MSTFQEIETLAGKLVIASKEYQEKRNEWVFTIAKKRQTLAGDTCLFSIKSQEDIQKMNDLLRDMDDQIESCRNWFQSYNEKYSLLKDLLVCENRTYHFRPDFEITRKGNKIETSNNDTSPIYSQLDFDEIH